MPFTSVHTENGTPVCLHYEDHGEGRPVVLMHGWPPSARSCDRDIARLTTGLSADRLGLRDRFTAEMFRAGERTDLVGVATLGYYWGIAAQASAKATLDCVTAFAHTDLRNDLAAVTVPTLIIHGDSDAVFPYEATGARAHRAINGSEAVVIPVGPHSVNVTHPPQFNPALLDFLEA